jgi:hypothetical protein
MMAARPEADRILEAGGPETVFEHVKVRKGYPNSNIEFKDTATKTLEFTAAMNKSVETSMKALQDFLKENPPEQLQLPGGGLETPAAAYGRTLGQMRGQLKMQYIQEQAAAGDPSAVAAINQLALEQEAEQLRRAAIEQFARSRGALMPSHEVIGPEQPEQPITDRVLGSLGGALGSSPGAVKKQFLGDPEGEERRAANRRALVDWIKTKAGQAFVKGVVNPALEANQRRQEREDRERLSIQRARAKRARELVPVVTNIPRN